MFVKVKSYFLNNYLSEKFHRNISWILIIKFYNFNDYLKFFDMNFFSYLLFDIFFFLFLFLFLAIKIQRHHFIISRLYLKFIKLHFKTF